MNYLDVYKARVGHLGNTPQERAYKSGILEFRRYLKYNSHTERGLVLEKNDTIFDGVILTDKEDDNRVSQILLTKVVEDGGPEIYQGDLIRWYGENVDATTVREQESNKTEEEKTPPWLIYQTTTSSYQPHQKFYMVRCNQYIKWIDADGALQQSWIYLLGSKDSKIKDNFRTWNEMITPQPNKYTNIILPHTIMPINTEIMVMGEVWYLVDYDQSSVPGITFMSFTETNVNQQRDDVKNAIANADNLAQWSITAAATQQVKPKSEVIVECYVSKNGVPQNISSELLTYSVEGNLYLKEGKVYSTSSGKGFITISYNGGSFRQEILISEEETHNCVLVGNDKIRVSQSSEYTLENASEAEFIISDTKLATITVDGNKCVVQANQNNKLGNVQLTAIYQGQEFTKTIQIVSLWQVI